jgi:hypothetical protein
MTTDCCHNALRIYTIKAADATVPRHLLQCIFLLCHKHMLAQVVQIPLCVHQTRVLP